MILRIILCFLRFDLHLLSFLSLCLPGHTGRFIRVVFCTSLLFVLAHICFQTVLYTYPPLNIAIGDNCSQWDTISRNIGLSRYVIHDTCHCHCQDTSLLCYNLICSHISSNITQEAGADSFYLPPQAEDEVSTATRAKQLAERLKSKARKVLRDLGKILAIGLLALAGITLPSAFSAIYFLLFIGVCTWWACHLPISHLGFNALCVMVGFFTAGHMVCLYVYQSLLAQALFPPHSLWARLFGLKAIIIPGNCSSPYDLNLNADHDWPVYVNPGILFLLYITLATVLKTGYHATSNQVTSLPVHSREEYKGNNKSMLYLCVQEVKEEQQQEKIEEEEEMVELRRSPISMSLFLLLVVTFTSQAGFVQHQMTSFHAVQVWSITYHSWLTFVLLLWACLIWMLRARYLRHAATLCSPFILLYGLALCCLQYVWAMELQPELPTMVGTMSLRQLGLDRAQHPCLRLGAMVRRENRYRGDSMKLNHAKYWIYVCGGMFIMVSFAGKLVGYKIIYMLLFLLCLCLYQVYYSLWRRLLKLFWWLVVAYTMLVLISIYTYQFEDFPGYWRNFTGFTEEQLAAIGLETFALSELFSSILIPGFFLLACILQLHYFHKPFMRITDLEHPRGNGSRGVSTTATWSLYFLLTATDEYLYFLLPCVTEAFYIFLMRQSACRKKPGERTERSGSGHVGVHCEEEDLATNIDEEAEDKVELMPSKWALVMDRLLVLSRRFSDTLTQVQVFLWRLLELHILKMVAFFSVWVSLEEPSVMNLVLVVLWSLAMPYSRFGPMASCLSTVWVCVIIVCKMLYQLSVVNPVEYSSNCSLPLTNETNLLPEEMMNSSLYEEPVDPARWFGIRKDATVLGYSKNHLIVLMLLVFEATVYRHQSHHYRQLQRSPPTIPALFPAATRDTLDQGLVPCLKYLLNYTFYKFGLEICFLMTVNVIGQRMNFLVIIHGCWLVAILVRRRRAAIATIWPKYCLFLSIFMIYQYLLCVGMPPALCIDYPWRWNTPVLINSALVKWIFLPDFYTVPNSKNLIADFALLMCASQQWKVFECEHKEEWMVLAGENTDDPEPMEGRLFNPAPNFINCRSYLDMAKVLVFRHLFWFVLSVVFITGATRISVFGLGYLLACFFFLLFGTRLLVKSSRTRLALWDCLIIYNVAVIVSKNMLSILACVFVFEMQKGFCWVIQLFSLVCTVKGYYDPVSDKTCSLPVEEAGVIWDSICFLCLLLQRRVFLSYYFLHVTAELQASAKQASRTLKYVSPFTVLHSGEYYLFESDSEDEEDSEEQKPQKQTACEVRRHCFTRCTSINNIAVPFLWESRILDILHLLLAIVLAMVDGLTQWLNLLTKQYRETSTVLCNERYFIVHKIQQGNNSFISDCVWPKPLEKTNGQNVPQSDHWRKPMARMFLSLTIGENQWPEWSSIWPLVRNTLAIGFYRLLKDWQFFIEELAQSREFYNNQSRLLKLLFAMYNLLAANSELVCYFIIVLNNAVSASVISLALPILVFLWAMLAVPRPTKKFWMTAIVYTEVMVVVKYLFQFGFFPWNSVHEMTLNEDKPFFPPCILGLEKTDNYIRYDLLQLLALFFHRSLLMRYGLWDHEGPLEDRVSSTSTLDNLEITELDQLEKVGGFFRGILHAEYRTATDVYALMFLTDVVDFIIIVFGFWAFGKHSAAADIASTLSEDQVPEAFLVMLLLQFSTMIIDRALYLRKAVLGKLIFQVILVFGIHLWMFFILPAVTERKFNQNFVAQLWYFVKCIYFGLSAYQIRCGYPTRILGNILTKKYNHLNLFLFQGFRLVPFLVELRAVMDWVWTDTTLSLSNWMCVEDIYANIFIIKCSRETEKKYPQPKGQKKKKIVKYGMGGLIIFFLICIIWFPLLFISLVRSVVGVVNHPIDVTVTVKLGGYESLFTMSVQQQSIQPFTQAEYDQLTHNFGDNVAMQFITLYGYEDIVTAMIEGSSGSVWRISPPSRQEVIKELLGSPVDLTLRLVHTSVYANTRITVFISNNTYSCILQMASCLFPRFVPHMIPNYIRAPNGAEAKPVNQLYKGEDGYLNITLSLKSDRSLNGSGNQEWWDIAIAGCRSSSCGVLPIVIFNDKVSPPSLGFLAGYGIMGLYLSVVLVIGKFVRGFFSEISHSIMFEELPCVDRILKLCTDIFLVRETGELELEEELYSKLIFLYRSPETMIKWTRDMHSRDHNRY
uniref:Piezo type mechanosensitive ion channel component 1 (Er blood group) n=1 Tax=Cyclopterus lumpus TaxID=8103 RepID=A0A8C2ZCE5_CYCLU